MSHEILPSAAKHKYCISPWLDCDWLSRLPPWSAAAFLSRRSCCALRRACQRRGRRWGGGWQKPPTGSVSWKRTCWGSPREACKRKRSSIGEWRTQTRDHQSSISMRTWPLKLLCLRRISCLPSVSATSPSFHSSTLQSTNHGLKNNDWIESAPPWCCNV